MGRRETQPELGKVEKNSHVPLIFGVKGITTSVVKSNMAKTREVRVKRKVRAHKSNLRTRIAVIYVFERHQEVPSGIFTKLRMQIQNYVSF